MDAQLLAANQAFVKEKKYESYRLEKCPLKKLAVLSCMDARLTELLPAALGLKNSDAIFIKNAGAFTDGDYGDVMRSLLIAIYSLGVCAVLVVGHTDCGVQKLDVQKMRTAMKERGITEEKLALPAKEGVNLHTWLGGFDEEADRVLRSCGQIRRHPLIPADIEIDGGVLDITTGAFQLVSDI